MTHDTLIGALIGLVRAADGSSYGLTTDETDRLILEGLTADPQAESAELQALVQRIEAEKHRLAPNCALCTASCGRTENYDMALLKTAREELRERKHRILASAREIANCLHSSGSPTRESCRILYRALFALGEEWSAGQLENVLAALEAR